MIDRPFFFRRIAKHHFVGFPLKSSGGSCDTIYRCTVSIYFNFIYSLLPRARWAQAAINQRSQTHCFVPCSVPVSAGRVVALILNTNYFQSDHGVNSLENLRKTKRHYPSASSEPGRAPGRPHQGRTRPSRGSTGTPRRAWPCALDWMA